MYLRTLRIKRGWTQKDLAKKTKPHVAQNTISKLERLGHIRVSHWTAVALAAALDVDPATLRFGVDPRSRAAKQPDARRGPRLGPTDRPLRGKRKPKTPAAPTVGLGTAAEKNGIDVAPLP